MAMPDSPARHEGQRFNAASWTVLCGAVLILAFSFAQTLYRKSLPTDGWALDYYAVASKGQLVYGTNISGLPSPLESGDALVSIEGQTADDILGRALTLQSQPPERWQAGHTARYKVLRDGREIALDVPLQEWQESIPSNVLYALWHSPSILPQLLIAIFVFWRRPGNQAARLLLLVSVAFFEDGAINQTLAHRITDVQGIALSVGEMFYRGAFWPMQFFSSLIWGILTTPLYTHLFLSFPKRKQIVQRHPRIVLGMLYGTMPALLLLSVFIAGGSAIAFWGLYFILGILLTLAMSLVCMASGLHSIVTARREADRTQIRWVAWGFLVPISIALGAYGLVQAGVLEDSPLLDYLAYNFVFLLIPISLAVAILRYRLFDVDTVINRTIVYGVLTAVIVGLYVLSVGLVGTLLNARDNLLIGLVATGAAAVLFQPLRVRLQRAVNRWTYGYRDDPYEVLSRLGQRLKATLAPDAILPAIVETVAQALKLPYAAISLKQGEKNEIVAAYGVPVNGVPIADSALVRIPLAYQSENIGELLLAPRALDESFTPGEIRLLEDISQQVGVAAHSVRLTTELQRSRERLVTSLEEERRRLRRDLHDGLGPALASLTLTLDAANNLLDQNPAAIRPLLADLKEQAQGAIVDIRRLVYSLRPPALDELGLISALREQAAQYSLNGLRITIEAPNDLPPLPAAVEVAAYRIAQEALTNVVRHAHAHNCSVRFSVSDGLQVEVRDDGSGLRNGFRAGVGLASMRERAEELGGWCLVEPGSPGGTRVLASLPILHGVLAPVDER